jgi:hypothetical protein
MDITLDAMTEDMRNWLSGDGLDALIGQGVVLALWRPPFTEIISPDCSRWAMEPIIDMLVFEITPGREVASGLDYSSQAELVKIWMAELVLGEQHGQRVRMPQEMSPKLLGPVEE